MMRPIDDLARAITELNPSEQQALMEKVLQLKTEHDRKNGTDTRLELMQEAMTDELFLADLREVMDDFRYTDSEGTSA